MLFCCWASVVDDGPTSPVIVIIVFLSWLSQPQSPPLVNKSAGLDQSRVILCYVFCVICVVVMVTDEGLCSIRSRDAAPKILIIEVGARQLSLHQPPHDQPSICLFYLARRVSTPFQQTWDIYWLNVGLMLGQHRIRWASIQPAYGFHGSHIAL